MALQLKREKKTRNKNREERNSIRDPTQQICITYPEMMAEFGMEKAFGWSCTDRAIKKRREEKGERVVTEE